MEQTKIGGLIRKIRTEKNMTQLELVEKLCVSDKTVSKWECGGGCPDLSLFPRLSEVLGIDTESLVNGVCGANAAVNGNLKNITFYVCPQCGNIVYQLGGAGVSCCGQKLRALVPEKACSGDEISAERIENDYFITAEHEMTKTHYISFIAFVTGDTVIFKKLYPEQNMQTRIPFSAHGRLYWYCTQCGLKYTDL